MAIGDRLHFGLILQGMRPDLGAEHSEMIFAQLSRSPGIVLVVGLVVLLTTAPAASDSCSRPELVWEKWRDHVLASNPGTDYFELRGDGRDEILWAYRCKRPGSNCPPDQLMVFHCIGNERVLLAFVHQGCVTFAKDILIGEYVRMVRGSQPC